MASPPEEEVLLTAEEVLAADEAGRLFVEAWGHYIVAKGALARRKLLAQGIRSWNLAFLRAIQRWCRLTSVPYEDIHGGVTALVKALQAKAVLGALTGKKKPPSGGVTH